MSRLTGIKFLSYPKSDVGLHSIARDGVFQEPKSGSFMKGRCVAPIRIKTGGDFSTMHVLVKLFILFC